MMKILPRELLESRISQTADDVSFFVRAGHKAGLRHALRRMAALKAQRPIETIYKIEAERGIVEARR